MHSRATVLLSGGIDSAACARFLQDEGHTVSCVFIDYGQAAAGQEKYAATSIATHLRSQLSTISVTPRHEFGAGEITGRNAFLVLAAMMLCDVRSGVLALGIHSGTPYYDCGPAFLVSIDRLVAEYTDGLARVAAPFISWTKRETFEYYCRAGIPAEISYSCEAGTMPPCGGCASCLDRRMLGCFT
jgi:7-cyano-7-deazaguanine synthase